MSGVKLPLISRKNIRDEFDNQKDDLQKKFKDILGEDYTFDVDFPALFAQADEGYQKDQIGEIAFRAIQDLWDRLQSFTKNGEDKTAVAEFNTMVSKRSITVLMDINCPGTYCGCRITGGVYEIVFQPKGLGTNLHDCNANLAQALDAAIASANPKALPLTVKMGIKKDWEDQKAELEKKMSEQLNGNTITCHVDYEDIWGKIVDAQGALSFNNKGDIDLEHYARQFGYFIHCYFESLLDKMKREFNNDDMVVEAFFDKVTEKQAWFAIVKERELKGSYSDTTIEGGRLYAKTKPTMFGTNVDNAFEGIIRLL